MLAPLVTPTTVTLVSRRWGRLHRRPQRRDVIAETTLKLFVHDLPPVTFCCLDEYLKELALGYLYTAGRIDSLREVRSLVEEPLRGEPPAGDPLAGEPLAGEPPAGEPAALRITLSPPPPARPGGDGTAAVFPAGTCPAVGRAAQAPVSMRRVWRLMQAFGRQSALFAASGGVHSALLLSGELRLFNEDIGRHNCIDKIAGRLLASGRADAAAGAILFSSGRVSVGIMHKLLRLGVAVCVSRTTPTDRAVALAREHDLALLGYVRGRRGVVYAGHERIGF